MHAHGRSCPGGGRSYLPICAIVSRRGPQATTAPVRPGRSPDEAHLVKGCAEAAASRLTYRIDPIGPAKACTSIHAGGAHIGRARALRAALGSGQGLITQSDLGVRLLESLPNLVAGPIRRFETGSGCYGHAANAESERGTLRSKASLPGGLTLSAHAGGHYHRPPRPVGPGPKVVEKRPRGLSALPGREVGETLYLEAWEQEVLSCEQSSSTNRCSGAPRRWRRPSPRGWPMAQRSRWCRSLRPVRTSSTARIWWWWAVPPTPTGCPGRVPGRWPGSGRGSRGARLSWYRARSAARECANGSHRPGRLEVAGAAFDTRLQGLPAFTGRASKSIGRLLAHHGARIAASPESFLVGGLTGALAEGELGRARAWGERLSAVTASEASPGRRQAS